MFNILFKVDILTYEGVVKVSIWDKHSNLRRSNLMYQSRIGIQTKRRCFMFQLRVNIQTRTGLPTYEGVDIDGVVLNFNQGQTFKLGECS